tara:strand:- start:1843 stop:2022 length:180 start_codon:yes stop_codon:yes gene_type:complete
MIMTRGYSVGKIMGLASCSKISIELIIRYNNIDENTKEDLERIIKSLDEMHSIADKIEL